MNSAGRADVPRELQKLRVSLDARLDALERALADPGQHGSLEHLILDLARVATDEADASARQAGIEAERQAIEQAQAALQFERESLSDLRRELDAALAALEEERGRTSSLQKTVEQAQAAAQSERAAAAARERDLIATQQKAEGARKAEEAAHASVRRELEQAQLAVETERAATAQLRGTISDFERRLEAAHAELDSTRLELESTRVELGSARGELDLTRRQLDRTQRDVEAHSQAASGTHAELEQALRSAQNALRETEARVGEALRERDELERQRTALKNEQDDRRTGWNSLDTELDATAEAAGDAALQSRLDELQQASERRTRALELAIRDAEGRAEAAETELALLRAAAPPAIATPDPVMPAAAPPAADQKKEEYRGPARAAKRVAISGEFDIQIDGAPAKLIDVSVTGAQILASSSMKPNRLVRLTLPHGDKAIVCKAKIMWSRLEPRAGQIWYRAGVSFTGADQTALEVFLDGQNSAR